MYELAGLVGACGRSTGGTEAESETRKRMWVACTTPEFEGYQGQALPMDPGVLEMLQGFTSPRHRSMAVQLGFRTTSQHGINNNRSWRLYHSSYHTESTVFSTHDKGQWIKWCLTASSHWSCVLSLPTLITCLPVRVDINAGSISF